MVRPIAFGVEDGCEGSAILEEKKNVPYNASRVKSRIPAVATH